MTTLPLQALATHLAPAVGDARATSATQEAARALGISGTWVEKADAIRILEHLATKPDVVGIAARLLKFRVEFAFETLTK